MHKCNAVKSIIGKYLSFFLLEFLAFRELPHFNLVNKQKKKSYKKGQKILPPPDVYNYCYLSNIVEIQAF